MNLISNGCIEDLRKNNCFSFIFVLRTFFFFLFLLFF